MTNAEHRPRRGFHLVVAGGGIASLFLGVALKRALRPALDVTVVEPASGAPDTRAYAVSPAAGSALRAIGVWDSIASHAQPISGMRITDGRAKDVVRQDYLGFEAGHEGPLAWLIEAGHLTRSLGEAAIAAGIERRADRVVGHAASGTAVSVELASGEAIKASLLIAADGARSRLREAARIDWMGRPYRQIAIVGTIAHERDHEGIAIQHFLPGGPFAILPLAGPGRLLPFRSSIVWSEHEGVGRGLLAGAETELNKALAMRFGRDLGEIAVETPLTAFPLASGLARRMVAERFALLGDAAHQIHPLAGQGLNLALGDAAALAEHIVASVRLGLDPGRSDVLDAYERDRRFDATALAGLTDGLNRLFSNDSLPLRLARDIGLGLVDRMPALKNAFGREAAGRSARTPRLMRGEEL